MSYLDYWFFLEDNFWGVTILSIITLLFYIYIYRKYIFSLYDPLTLAVIICGLANSTVIFLYFYGKIEAHYLYYFLLNELAFLVGFFLIRPIGKKDEPLPEKAVEKWYDSDLFIKNLFYWSSAGHVLLQLFSYSQTGLPILMESRMLTYSGGSGFGMVGRAIEISGGVGTILLMYRLFYLKNDSFDKSYNYIYLFFVLFFFMVSGNKTNIVYLVHYLFLLQLSMKRIFGPKALAISKKIFRFQTILFICAIPLIFLVMYIQFVQKVGDAEGLELGNGLVFRILSFGDVYYMSLPNDVILRMNHDSAFIQIFKDVLGVFRIMRPAEFPMDCGVELNDYHAKIDALGTGPNARYNYFAMLYFDLPGQIVYCFVIGFLTSFIRNSLYRLLAPSLIFHIIYILMSFNLIYMYQDQSYTLGHNMNILYIYPVLLILSTVSYAIVSNWKMLIAAKNFTTSSK